MKLRWVLAIVALVASGCTKEPGSTKITEGKLVIECDESVAPVFDSLAAIFQDQYPDAKISLRKVEAREAIANFFNDSVQVIVSARSLNGEEKGMLKAARVEYQEFHVAMSAVAVIGNRNASIKRLRMTEADSIFAGKQTRWPRGRVPIELVVGDVNSSTNEAFRSVVMGGSKFTLTASPFRTSREIVDYVARTPGTLGIVGIAWLKGFDNSVTVMELGGPSYKPDTAAAVGQYYTPAQAFIFQEYYPVRTPVYIYTRMAGRDLALGFISFVMGVAGQQVVTREGLVPVTMPVRLVQLTSDQVN